MTVVLDNGNTRSQTAKDTTGGRNPDGVDFYIVEEIDYYPRTIRAVKLHLYEYDAERNATADTADKRIKTPK